MKKTILIIDDEEEMCLSLSEIVTSRGYHVLYTTKSNEVPELLLKHTIDMIISDVRMPDLGGIGLLKTIRDRHSNIPIIMISGYASTTDVVTAMKYGALNFYEKPLDISSLLEEIDEYLKVPDTTSADMYFTSNSKTMQDIFHIISTAAPTEAPVIITGESGTGKEKVASAIHYMSKRADNSYVKLNCAAIPDNLLESELFGYKKGAFTDAKNDKTGKFELADKGSIFFDEIGDMSLNTQAKLLRVLQEKEFEMLGGNRLIKADVRIVTATNKDLQKLIQEGKFREDLYYRLSVINIYLPPLRERMEDIDLLSNYFLKEYNSVYNKNILSISRDVLDIFHNHTWPGNIRELKNVMERSVIFCNSTTIQRENLPFQYREKNSMIHNAPDIIYENLSKQMILEALEKSGGIKQKAAEMLNIHRKTLYNRMKKYGIE